jgi:hypothetical protein
MSKYDSLCYINRYGSDATLCMTPKHEPLCYSQCCDSGVTVLMTELFSCMNHFVGVKLKLGAPAEVYKALAERTGSCIHKGSSFASDVFPSLPLPYQAISPDRDNMQEQ